MPFSYIYWKNTDGIYLVASTNELQLFDNDSKSFVGKTIFEILKDYNSAKAVDDIDNKIMQDGLPVTIEETLELGLRGLCI